MPNSDELTKEIDNALAELGTTDQELITRDQLVEGYKAYASSSSGIHNERLREDGKSFDDALRESGALWTPEENKRVSDLIANACGL